MKPRKNRAGWLSLLSGRWLKFGFPVSDAEAAKA